MEVIDLEEIGGLTAEERVLLVASNDIGAAVTLERVMETTPLRLSPEHMTIAQAIIAVLRSGSRRVMSPTLVEERVGSKIALFSQQDYLDRAREYFEHDLVFLGEKAQADLAQIVAAQAVNDLETSGVISATTRRSFRELATLPDAALVISQRNTHYTAVVDRRKETKEKIFFGLRPIDRALAERENSPLPGYYQPSNLLVIGAETGVGKTSFSMEIAMRGASLYNHLYKAKREVVIYSAEQTAEDLVELAGLLKGGRWREIYDELGAGVHFVDRTDYGNATVENVVAHLVNHVQSQIRIQRSTGRSTEEIQESLPLIIVVDYAKLFSDRRLPLVQGIEHVAATLKTEVALGGAFDLTTFPELVGWQPAVILPTQVKRPKTLSKDAVDTWRPTLDDLADCRGIVDYADIVALLHRDFSTETAEVKLAKVRRSRRGVGWVEIGFSGGQWYGDTVEYQRGFRSTMEVYSMALSRANSL